MNDGVVATRYGAVELSIQEYVDGGFQLYGVGKDGCDVFVGFVPDNVYNVSLNEQTTLSSLYAFEGSVWVTIKKGEFTLFDSTVRKSALLMANLQVMSGV